MGAEPLSTNETLEIDLSTSFAGCQDSYSYPDMLVHHCDSAIERGTLHELAFEKPSHDLYNANSASYCVQLGLLIYIIWANKGAGAVRHNKRQLVFLHKKCCAQRLRLRITVTTTPCTPVFTYVR